MSRVCVPGLLALLAAVPLLTVRADDKVEAPAPAAAPAPVPAAPPAVEKPAVAPAADKPAADKPAADKPAADKPAADKPAADKPAADKPAADKPAADKPAADKPAADKPAADKPAADKPAADKPAADKPAADKPAADKAAAAPAAAVKQMPALKLAPALRVQLGDAVRARVAATAAGGANDDDDSKPAELSEEDKKVMDEFVQKAVKTKKKQFEDAMKAEVESVAKDTKLDSEGQKKLSTLSAKAVEAALPEWEKAFRKWVETILPQAGGSAKALATWSAESYAKNTSITGFSLPGETEAWKSVLKEVLTPAQLTVRTETVKAAEKKFQEDFGDYLATCEGQAGDQMAAAVDAELNRIVQFSGMDDERQKKLKAAGDEAVKQCVKDWRTQMEKQLKAMDQKQREQTTSRGGMASVNMSEKSSQPKERAVWKDAVAVLLTEKERATLEERYLEVRGRRADALAIVLVNDLDKLVGFAASQRQQFLPLAAKRLLKLPDYYFVNPDNGGWYSIDMGQMLQLAQKAKDEELKPILSEAQLKRFRSASPDQMSRGNSYVREKLDLGDMPKPEEMDEVEVERLLSRFLHREAKKMKLKMFSTMEARVEHVSRVINPSPETVGVLTTAAKGAAEELAQSNIMNLSSWLRAQFQNVKPSDVPGRLENLYTPYFSSPDRNQPVVPAIWTSAVQRLLTEEQRKLWKVETDAREQWRREGLSGMVVTEVEKRIVLSAEQRTKLAAKVATVLQDYEPDFSNYLSAGWHLQGYYTMIPIAMFTDKEMAEHFDKKQIEVLKDKALSNAMQYAEMIRNNHNSRIRRQ